MTTIRLVHPDLTLEKWFIQNDFQTIDTFPSVLLDYYHGNCKNGEAFIFDHYLNSCSSCYEIRFFRTAEIHTEEYKKTESLWYKLYDEYCDEYCMEF